MVEKEAVDMEGMSSANSGEIEEAVVEDEGPIGPNHEDREIGSHLAAELATQYPDNPLAGDETLCAFFAARQRTQKDESSQSNFAIFEVMVRDALDGEDFPDAEVKRERFNEVLKVFEDIRRSE